MKPIIRIILPAAAILATVVLVSTLNAAENQGKKQPKDIHDVMEWSHKGRQSVVNKIKEGNGTPDEVNMVLRYYKFMATQEPPRGEMTSWKEKTAELIAAMEAVKKSESGSLERYKDAVNCKACHDLHKPEDN